MDAGDASHQSSSLLPPEHGKKKLESFNADSSEHKVSLMAKEADLSPNELFRQSYLLLLVIPYACLSIITWTLLCIQNKRPLTTKTYGLDLESTDILNGKLEHNMSVNANWFHALKIFLSITNTLIIPLTSTVCASVCVIYIQHFGRARHFTMHHTSTLANRGWTSPLVWGTLLTRKGRGSIGSQFLAFAILFHALGFIIPPLQQYYVGQEIFNFQNGQVPGRQSATDVPDLFNNGDIDLALTVARLRNELSSVAFSDYQPALWLEGSFNCTQNTTSLSTRIPQGCYEGGTTFSEISTLPGPYIAQIPVGYTTGLLTQYLPRMNSSVSFTNVTNAEFPSTCLTFNDTSNIFYSHFVYNKTLLDVQVCIPKAGNGVWQSTRDRQDISEQLFLKVLWGPYPDFGAVGSPPTNTTFVLSVNTTLGYFELPNYQNNGIAGPLLAKDPIQPCVNATAQCVDQSFKKRTVQISESVNSYELALQSNAGPLVLMTQALFNPGSFIATQLSQFLSPDIIKQGLLAQDRVPGGWPVGQAIAPLIPLINTHTAGNVPELFPQPQDELDGYSVVSQWLNAFYSGSSMENALNAGIILASQAWLNTPEFGSLTIWYDMGLESVRVKISTTGVILISILLFIDLAIMIGLALYVRFSYSWTASYDSLAMMRQGAASADVLPLLIESGVGKKEGEHVLDDIPGWVGDVAPEREVGELGIGADAPLRPGRKYRVPVVAR